MPGAVGAAALFLGPLVVLLGALLLVTLVLFVARVVFGLAWRLAVIGAVVLGALWLLGAVGAGPPAFG